MTQQQYHTEEKLHHVPDPVNGIDFIVARICTMNSVFQDSMCCEKSHSNNLARQMRCLDMGLFRVQERPNT